MPVQDLRPTDTRRAVMLQLADLIKKYPEGLPALDPVEDMGLHDAPLMSAIGALQEAEGKLGANPVHQAQKDQVGWLLVLPFFVCSPPFLPHPDAKELLALRGCRPQLRPDVPHGGMSPLVLTAAAPQQPGTSVLCALGALLHTGAGLLLIIACTVARNHGIRKAAYVSCELRMNRQVNDMLGATCVCLKSTAVNSA